MTTANTDSSPMQTDEDSEENPLFEHPTLGRRRRHKSPPSLQSLPAVPVPRLADHLDTEIGPSDEEGGKRSEVTEVRADDSYLYLQQTPKRV